jgi:hypothetical protein
MITTGKTVRGHEYIFVNGQWIFHQSLPKDGNATFSITELDDDDIEPTEAEHIYPDFMQFA